jgi:hypothetical protein
VPGKTRRTCGATRTIHALCSRGGWNASGEWIPLPYIDPQKAEELFRYRVFRLLKDKGLLSEERIQLLRSWRRSGFSIDQSVRIPAGEKKGLETITRVRRSPSFRTTVVLPTPRESVRRDRGEDSRAADRDHARHLTPVETRYRSNPGVPPSSLQLVTVATRLLDDSSLL